MFSLSLFTFCVRLLSVDKTVRCPPLYQFCCQLTSLNAILFRVVAFSSRFSSFLLSFNVLSSCSKCPTLYQEDMFCCQLAYFFQLFSLEYLPFPPLLFLVVCCRVFFVLQRYSFAFYLCLLRKWPTLQLYIKKTAFAWQLITFNFLAEYLSFH